MKKRREAVAKTPVDEQELARLKDVESNYDQLEILYMREQESWQTLINKKNRRIRNLQHALRTAEHQVEVAASEQALRTRAVRDELAVANSEVAELKRNWTARSNTEDVTGQERDRLRRQLATLSGQYNELAAKYDHLSASAQRAAKERKQLQALVRQWDAMCVRLYKATGGRPRREADKKILATWTQFRKAVRK